MDAIYWIGAAWEKVSASCIQGCFRRAKFVLGEAQNDSVEEENSSLQELYELRNNPGMNYMDAGLDEFATFDNNLSTHQELNAEQILDDILHDHMQANGMLIENEGSECSGDGEEEEQEDPELEGQLVINRTEEEEENIPVPTYSEISKVMKYLKLFATTNEPALLKEINMFESKFNDILLKRKSKKIQTRIDTFFSRSDA